jgi:hypothetical protein
MKEIGLWEELAKKVHDIDCVLHMGDQVFLTTFLCYFLLNFILLFDSCIDVLHSAHCYLIAVRHMKHNAALSSELAAAVQ